MTFSFMSGDSQKAYCCIASEGTQEYEKLKAEIVGYDFSAEITSAQVGRLGGNVIVFINENVQGKEMVATAKAKALTG